MKKLRVAVFIDGSGEPVAAELSRCLKERNFECETFLFPLNGILNPTHDFLNALKSLSLSHAFLLPHPSAVWEQRSSEKFKSAWSALNAIGMHIFQATIPLPSKNSSYLERYNEFFLSSAKNNLVGIADVEQLASEYGPSRWLDSRVWEIAEIPLDLDALPILGNYLSRIVAASQGDIVKMIVLDLDQVLWPEILDEVGPEGIMESSSWEHYQKFQEYLLSLKKSGILLSVLSSNQSENVLSVFEKNLRLILKRDDFIHLELGWNNKAQGILKIAGTTRIHPSHMLYIDDSVVNQELIRKFVPETNVLKACADPIRNLDELRRGRFFIGNISTHEDVLRSSSHSPKKEELNQFLMNLNPELVIRKATEEDIPRIVQLHQRTNQFNLRTRRETLSGIKSSLQDLLILSFCDREMDYGIIGVVQLIQDKKSIIIHDWLLSCRVFSRNIEDAFLYWLRSRKNFSTKIIMGELIPGERNQFIHKLYERLGFNLSSKNGDIEVWADNKNNCDKPMLKITDQSGIL